MVPKAKLRSHLEAEYSRHSLGMQASEALEDTHCLLVSINTSNEHGPVGCIGTYHMTVRITVPTESEPAITFEKVQAVEALLLIWRLESSS
jgi:hypothetical protein